ncbi:MAG: hypothetical protein NTW21_41605 [Verrucomicrobia bacterium]|nr:hypothetical protein [Verrucomicrobiota bacterium]
MKHQIHHHPVRRNVVCLIATVAMLSCIPAASAADNDQALSLAIDAKNQDAVISPLLFAHNLEVTRRGIWRGLGGEMVANRKFVAVTNGLPRRWYSGTDAIFLERGEQPTVDAAGHLVLKVPRYSVAVLELAPLRTETSPTETKR